MNDLTITRTPDVIAAEINGIKAQTRAIMLCSSIEIGRRLVEAKAMLDHGQWLPWLERSVDYSERTAQNLMKIFEEYGASQIPLFGDNSKAQAFADLTYTQAIALLGVPADEREAFAVENDVANMKTRELQQAIKDRDDALALAKAAEKSAEEADNARETLETEYSKVCTQKTAAERKATVAETALQTAQDKAKKEIDRLNKQLAEAKKAGTSEDKLAELTGELEEAKEEVRRLTEQLAQPVTVEATVQPDPAAVAVMKFGIQFDALVGNFKNLLAALGEIKDADAETHEKYKGAVAGLIGKMTERLV